MDELNTRIAALSPAKRALLEQRLQKANAEAAAAAISRRVTDGPVPLSFAQQRLWFLDQLEPGGSNYNIPISILLSGPLDANALERSLSEILRRHEALRTVFSTKGGTPVQIVNQPQPFVLQRADLSATPNERREEESRRLASEEAARPFNLATGPLLRGTLLAMEPQKHVLLLVMHHIVSDGWSISVLFKEMSSLYGAFSKNDPSALPELPIQYPDFAAWQRRWLQGEVLSRQLTYWREQLHGLPTLDLPTDHPRPPMQTFHGARHAFRLSQDLLQALQSLSRAEGVTLFITLMAAFQGLLSRYTGQEDIVVGAPIANRTRVELEGLIGFFVNMLVLRTDVSGDPTFRGLLARARTVALAGYAHQDIPFEKLVEELHPRRDPSRNPLFQVAFILQNVPRSTLTLPGLTMSRTEIDGDRIRFDIEVHLHETHDGLHGIFIYNTDLFETATIERMAGHFARMLEGIVADPDQRLSQLPILTDKERHQLLVEWNDTAIEYPRDKCIHELFEAQMERTPDAVALVVGAERFTYRELNARANQLAHHLRSLGVGPDVLVAICMERSFEMVIGLLAVLKAGGAYVPLDPLYPQERLAFILEDTHVPVLLTQERLVSRLPPNPARVLCLDTLDSAAENGENPRGGATAGNLAYVIFTSGSTGRPKGVAIEHRSTVALVEWARTVFTAEELAGVMFSTSICFDLSVFELFVTLSCGGKVILAENPLQLSSLPAVAEVTLVNTVPSAIAELIRDGSLPPSVRTVTLAGETLPRALADKIYQNSAAQKVYDLYGPSEGTTYSTFALRTSGGIATIGRPISNTQVYLLDTHLQPVPIGVPGEIHIGGAGLARGYLNRPDLTTEKFIPNPFGHKAWSRLYKTGDLARNRPDGNIDFLGRMDHQVKIRGFRIELGEIETCLRKCPGVTEAIVITRISTTEDKQLVAYIVPPTNERPSIEMLRQFLHAKLPAYMVPSIFVFLDSFPLMPNGKVDRKALPDHEFERPKLGTAFAEPRRTVEERVARIWSELLGIGSVGIHDSFFDLGGHSLLAIQLISRLRQMFRVELPVRTLFDSPTVAQLAARIEECLQGIVDANPAPVTTWTYLVPIQRSGTRRPLFLVPGGGGGEDEFLVYARLARLVGEDFPLYGLQARGCDGQREPHTRVEQMATDYIMEIRACQPEGPYQLAGECLGGIIAYEMAQQLMEQGQKVSLLLLLDTPRPTLSRYVRHRVAKSIAAIRNRWQDFNAERLVMHWEKLRKMEPRKRPSYLTDKAHKSVLAAAYALRLKRIPDPEGKLEVVQHVRRARAGYASTILRYKPKPYRGKITLITSESWDHRGPSRSWGDLAGGGTDIIQVPGAHLSYIRAHAADTAVQLRACLEKAEGNEG